MTLAHGTDRLESARLVLRRVAPDDLPFFTRIHALPEVAQHLYPGGRPRSPEETAAWLTYTLKSYEQLALGYLAVLRKEDGALIGRCGLMDLVVESAGPEHGIRRGWFGRDACAVRRRAELECGLGYTFDPAAWGQGFATEAGVLRSRLRARRSGVVVRGLGHSSAERPLAARRRTGGRASRRPNGGDRSHVGTLGVAARDRRRGSAGAGIHEIGVLAPEEATMTTTLATWTIDPVHSSVEFPLDYMGFSTYRTGFRALEGSLEFDAARPAASSVNASIPVASVDVTNDRLMSRLMDPDLLGGRDHPTITFKSTRVESLDPAHWKVTGDLTIHGVAQPVVLEHALSRPGQAPVQVQDRRGLPGGDGDRPARLRGDLERGHGHGRRVPRRARADLARHPGRSPGLIVTITPPVSPGPWRKTYRSSTGSPSSIRVPRDGDLHGESGNPRLLLSPRPPRGLWDRRLGTPVRSLCRRSESCSRSPSYSCSCRWSCGKRL